MSLPERVRAVRDYLEQTPSRSTPAAVARSFKGSKVNDVIAILDTLTALGHAKRDPSGYSV